MRKEIEQLRESIASIKQEANEKKIAERQAQIQKEKEESDRREKERAEQEMADRNWPLVRGQIKAFLHKLNKEALNSEGEVIEGIRPIPYHDHGVFCSSGHGEDYVSWTGRYYLEGRSDVLELKVKEVGSVVVFRPLEVMEYVYIDEYGERYRSAPTNKVPPANISKIKGRTVERHKLDDDYRKEMRVCLLGKDYEGESGKSFDFCPDSGGENYYSRKKLQELVLDLSSLPEEVVSDAENDVSEKIVMLYKEALLG